MEDRVDELGAAARLVEVLDPNEESAAYDAALAELRQRGLVYPCFCTRSDIAAALEAPHGAQGRYPGTCRGLLDDPERRASEPHSWRFEAEKAIERAGLPGWSEGDRRFASKRSDTDDVILARKDAPAAYHLACVVDDAASGVTLVTRAADLRPSTPESRIAASVGARSRLARRRPSEWATTGW